MSANSFLSTLPSFGDIDVGGFEIYLDLCRKTGIPFPAVVFPVFEKYARKYDESLHLWIK